MVGETPGAFLETTTLVGKGFEMCSWRRRQVSDICPWRIRHDLEKFFGYMLLEDTRGIREVLICISRRRRNLWPALELDFVTCLGILGGVHATFRSLAA